MDAGNPVVWLHAGDLGLAGHERTEINDDHDVLDLVREARGKACVLMGLCDDWRRGDEDVPAVPLVGLVTPPRGYLTVNGRRVEADEMDLRLHLIFMNRLHESVAGTASISLAAASRIPGTTVHAVARRRRPDTVLIGHPSGVTGVSASVAADADDQGVRFGLLGISRTARRLMAGRAFYPRHG
ncbi:MAG: PrpF domain-containing protein [Spirillospora sp.]